jgi:hypothetical protein
MLDTLRAGKIKFAKAASDIIEMKHKGCTYVFFSKDEAVSFSQLPKDVKFDSLREQISEMASGYEWTELFGLKWRRPPNSTQEKKEQGESDQKVATDPASKTNGPSSLLSIADEFFHHDKHFLKHSAVVKEDLLTCRKLVGFETVAAAYKDWTETLLCSPTFPESEAQTTENFQQYYLDGDRNVDAIVWRSNKDATPYKDEEVEPNKTLTDQKSGSQECSPQDVAAHTPAITSNGIATEGCGTLPEAADAIIPPDPKIETKPVPMDICNQNAVSVADSQMIMGKRKRLEDDNNVEPPSSKRLAGTEEQNNSSKPPLGTQTTTKDDSGIKEGLVAPGPFVERQNGEDVQREAEEKPIVNTL